MTALSTLHQSDLIEVQTLFAHGYTIRYIRNWLFQRAAEFGRMDMVPTEQDLLRLAALYAEDIEKVREELAKDTLQRGLARKEERISRLTQAAETIEPQVMDGTNLKATEMFRRLIKDIATEVDGLNIRIMMPDDPWALLLIDLKERAALPGTTQSTLLPTKANSTSESDQVPEKSTQSATPSSNKDTPLPTQDKESSSTNVTD